MKRFLAFAVAIAVASFGFLTAADAATTFFVDDSNCPGPGTGSKNNPFCTIGAAVAAALAMVTVLFTPRKELTERLPERDASAVSAD